MVDDAIWRKRLLFYTLVRASGLVLFFLGIAIIYTNFLRVGGWPQLGAVIAILGAIDALVVPHLFKRSWDREDQGRK